MELELSSNSITLNSKRDCVKQQLNINSEQHLLKTDSMRRNLQLTEQILSFYKIILLSSEYSCFSWEGRERSNHCFPQFMLLVNLCWRQISQYNLLHMQHKSCLVNHMQIFKFVCWCYCWHELRNTVWLKSSTQ